jgi:phospho-N-acetylmuramoyl-pentapeptide-transferase
MSQRKRGISAGVKFGGQILISAIIVTVLYVQRTDTTTLLYFPFLKRAVIDLGWVYIPFAVILMVGYSNAVNITDGLDGLAIGLVIMVALAFGVLSYLTGRADYADYLQIPFIKGGAELAVFSLAVVGASVGFLWFNAHPADVWKEILILILGGVFVLETLSVIIQVLSFKLTGRRVFKMAPLHHHFELSGWPESKVVTRMWILGGLFAILGLSTLKIQ